MEKLGWQVLLDAGAVRVPVDIMRVCARYAKVNSYTQAVAELGEDFRELCCDYTLLCGYTLRRNQETWVLYNDVLPPAEVRFTIAHETAHLVLHHISKGGQRFVYQQEQEREADALAAILLMPLPLLRKYKAQGGVWTPEGVAQQFQVSRQAAAQRFFGCNL